MYDSEFRRLHPLLALAVAISSLFALDRAGAFVMSKVVLQSHNRIAQVYAGKARGDILLLGNSVADAMVTVPLLQHATGLRAYTMAVHGLDARTQLVMVKAFLAHNPVPRYAIMEVRSASNRDVIAGQFAMFGRESPELIRLAEAESQSRIPWRRISALYNFNSRDLPSVLARVALSDDQNESGSDGRINEAKKRRFVERKLAVAVDPDALRAFVATIRLLQDNGTIVMVVAAPMHPVTRKLGNWADRYAATVQDALPPGTHFLNALRLYGTDATFEDPVHMNERGRQAFAPVLARTIVAPTKGVRLATLHICIVALTQSC